MLKGREILIYKTLLYKGDRNKVLDSIYNKEDIDEEEAKKLISEIKCNVLTLLDEDYPDYLKEVNYPPLVLFYYGDISLIRNYRNNIAVIGSRKASSYGLGMTAKIVQGICNKYTIVSGMAAGVDGCAHETALLNKGKTIAILGCGIDYIYPKTNTHLYINIKEKGLVISEYPGDQPPEIPNFPFRNRLISYMSKGILITEAKPKSGTLITVSWADMISREIMCVPYPATEESGCNHLIKNGCYLVENADDVLYIMTDQQNEKNH